MSFLVLVVVLSGIILGFGRTATSKNYYPIAKPNCDDRCGNVSIPFPFGLSKDCSLNSTFFIDCTTPTNGPPKPLLGRNGSLEVIKISVEGQLIVMNLITQLCYQKGVYSSRYLGGYKSGPSDQFFVNQTANKFVGVGCDTFANVYAYGDDRSYKTGSNCMATCESVREVVQNGSCAGIGCCETKIPNVARNVYYTVDTMKNYSYTSDDVIPCSYAFVVQKEEFNFSSTILTKTWDVKSLPLVLDWTISNETCNMACQGNTTCVPIDGEGYRCACKENYKGNPYLSGCQDIDECTNGHHNCSKNAICSNTEGSHECYCKKGYHGDGKGDFGCTSNNPLIKHVLGIGLGTITVLICGFCVYLGYQRRKSLLMKEKFFRENGGLILKQKMVQGTGTPRIFTAQELKKATNNFDQSRIIGQGGFGIVYKGHLLDTRIVAVKKPKMMDPTQVEQFINEVIVLSQINHKNIVKLYGCCLETEVPLLVYEFISNGTLSDHLHNNKNMAVAGPTILNWPTRLRIATETAEVLSYLHSSASPPIIHRDVKPANILLDNDFTARVSDFGASRLVQQDETRLITMVQGTLGYLDPEYLQTQELTEKSDVYSFGVVLVELLTGRRAVFFNCPEEERNLSQHFLLSLKRNELFKILDDDNVGNSEELREVALLAKRCLNVKGEDRPTMKEVAVELGGFRRAAKHHWINNNSETSIESQALLNEPQIPFEYDNTFSITTTSEYDSLKHHMELPVAAGR